MTNRLAHHIATEVIDGTVSVAIVRDHEGARFTVSYQSRSSQWLSHHRFPDVSQADAGALVLAEFLGAKVL